MNAVIDFDTSCSSTTDGEIAVMNLESACRRAWFRFAQDPLAPGVAESIVDMERLRIQFLGDVYALDDLEALAMQFSRADDSFRSVLVQAEIGSAAHRFSDARRHLSTAALLGAPVEAVHLKPRLPVDDRIGP